MNQELQQFIEEFKNLSNEPPIEIKISPLAAYLLIAQIQLAARHPENTGTGANQARDIAVNLQSRLNLSPAMEAIIHRGWLSEYDAIPCESADDYLSRVPQRQIIEVHNAYSIYSSEDEEQGFMMFSRPQDWANKADWAYERFKFEWVQEKTHFINHAHCWYNPKHIPRGEVPMAFGQGITMIAMPGKPEQLCSNQYLEYEDFWSEAWGKMPPVYEPPDELD